MPASKTSASLADRSSRAVTLPAPWRTALVLFAAALALRAVYLVAVSRTACLDINMDPISDMEAFHRWALSIASGDWLDRANFHPWHPWQEAVASLAQWQAWYGHAFHQEPFYPYLMALVYRVAPPEPFSMIALQALLGSAGCAFTYLAARRAVGEGGAVAAGVLAVLYGPFLYYESLLLRDAFLIPLHALLLWLVMEAWSRPAGREAARWWGAAGLAAGVSFVTKASILPYVLLLVALAAWQGRRGGSSSGWRAPAALAGACALVMAPVVARNAAVGAPWMQTTTRGPIEFINGNNPWHPGIGWFDGDDTRVSTWARETLAASGGRLLPTVRRVLSSWSGRPAAFAWLQVRKLGYAFAPFEMPNNASYSYFRSNVLLLRRGMLSFFWIAPLAALGLIASWKDRVLLLPLFGFLALGIATTVAFYVIARFRAPLMPAVLVLAGAGVAWLLERLRRRRMAAAAAGSALVIALLAIGTRFDYPDDELIRPQDYIIAVAGYRARGQMERALAEAHVGRARFPAFGIFWRESGLLELALGRRDEARGSLREALARDPRDQAAREALEHLQRAGGADILPPH